MPARTLSPKEMDCETLHPLERGTKYSLQGCENLSMHFKIVRLTVYVIGQNRQYLPAS